MHAHRAHRVVDVQLKVKELHHHYHKHARHNAYYHRAQSVQSVAAGGYAHKARKGGVQAHGHVGLAVLYPGVQHGGNCGHSRGYGGGQEDGRKGGVVPGRRAVKAVPAEPEDEAAQSPQGDGVAGDGVHLLDLSLLATYILAKPRAHHYGPDKGRDAAHRVYGRGAREVVKAQIYQPALAVPDPPGFYGVDEQGDDSGIDAVGHELCPLGH